MNAFLIGLTGSLLTIVIVTLLKRLDKNTFFGLILVGIGFLYVGYTWSDTTAFIISAVQALLFVLLAYVGIKKNVNYIIAGYFLHGFWDLVYGQFSYAGLLPPDYDIFCLTYDVVIGVYLWVLRYFRSR
jgi:hypothetical protein